MARLPMTRHPSWPYNQGMNKPAIDIKGLSPAQRLRLLEELWDSLADADVPLTERQREELDRRLDALENEGPRGIPWNEVLDRLESGAS